MHTFGGLGIPLPFPFRCLSPFEANCSGGPSRARWRPKFSPWKAGVRWRHTYRMEPNATPEPPWSLSGLHFRMKASSTQRVLFWWFNQWFFWYKPRKQHPNWRVLVYFLLLLGFAECCCFRGNLGFDCRSKREQLPGAPQTIKNPVLGT